MTNDELTLDPADWDEFRALAHRMVDDTIAHLASLHEQPAWRPIRDLRQVNGGLSCSASHSGSKTLALMRANLTKAPHPVFSCVRTRR